MITQKTLFGKKVEREEKSYEEMEQETEEQVKRDEIDTADYNFADDVDFAVFEIKYHKKVMVNGKSEEWISTDQTTEYKQHLNSSYGGGSYYTEKDLGKLKTQILSWFENHLKTPYLEFGKLDEDDYGFYVCDIKTENMILAISKKSLEFLKYHKFNVDELLKAIEELKKNRAKFTQEYQDKIEMYKDVSKFVYDTEWQIKDLVNVILDKGKILNPVIDLNKIWDRLNDLIEQLKDVDKDYSRLHNEFHSWEDHVFVVDKDEDWFWQRYNKAKKICDVK